MIASFILGARNTRFEDMDKKIEAYSNLRVEEVEGFRYIEHTVISTDPEGDALDKVFKIALRFDFLDFDMIVAMDDQNYEDLMHMAPSVEATHKIRKMASFLTTHKISYIPDPYYMGAEGFGMVLDLLEEGCANLFKAIVKAGY